jgi:hypothetical protein
VRDGVDAVQYVWEFALGSCDVPIVVGVHVDSDGFVVTSPIYWNDEPDIPERIGDLDQYMVSVRPGGGTGPTEGDVARWVTWQSTRQAPRDWMIADGLRVRSVRDVVAALRAREPMPAARLIAGDWDGSGLDETLRAELRATWAETKREVLRSGTCCD